jgi:hypothetical protein
VKYPHLGTELKVEPQRKTVQDLLANDIEPLDTDPIIVAISHHIDVTKGKVNINPIFKTFRTGSNPITFRGNIHCEALLATLIKYTEFLRPLLQVIFYLLHYDPY